MVINPYEVVDLRTVCEVRSQALDIKIVSYEYLTQKSKAMLEDCFRYKVRLLLYILILAFMILYY